MTDPVDEAKELERRLRATMASWKNRKATAITGGQPPTTVTVKPPDVTQSTLPTPRVVTLIREVPAPPPKHPFENPEFIKKLEAAGPGSHVIDGVTVIACNRGQPRARPPGWRHPDADLISRIPSTWGCPFCKDRFPSIEERNGHLKSCKQKK